MIKLSRYDLISPTPYWVEGVGHVEAIKLKDVDALPSKYDTYKQFVSLLLLDIDDYIEQFHIPKETIENVQKEFEQHDLTLCVYDIHIVNKQILGELLLALNFFITEDVSFDHEQGNFIVHNGFIDEGDVETPKDIVGYINRDNYTDVVEVILQRLGVKSAEDIEEEHPKFANEKARQMWERQQKFFKEQQDRESKANAEFFDLGNIISSLANRQSGLNMINIWDMTLYNVYDQFDFERDGAVYTISALNYSVWGSDEKHKFDIDAWFKRKPPVAGDSDDLFSMAQNAKNR